MLILSSGDDPERGWFTGAAKLGEVLIVVPANRPARLGYLTPMERDEAASTGLALLTPEELDIARWSRGEPSRGEALANVASRALQLCAVAPGAIVVGGRLDLGSSFEIRKELEQEGWSFVVSPGGLARLRRRKSPEEVLEVRRVASAVGDAFRAVATTLAHVAIRAGELWFEEERLTVRRLKSIVAVVLARHGLEQPRGNIVAPGEEGGVPHSAGNPERVLRPHESLVVDLFPRGTMFADCTRTFCVGELTPALCRAHASVVQALGLAHRLARPGASAWGLQEAVCARFGEDGYETPISSPGNLRGYVHGLGHGVGLELHELPTFRSGRGADGVLAADDLITLEPGLYEPGTGGFGVRLEDLIRIGEVENELLTPLPYGLDPRTWS